MARAPSLSTYLWLRHHTRFTPPYRSRRLRIFLLVSPFSTLHLLLTSSLHLLLSSSQTVSQSITRKSLCVVFGRTLFSATICLLLLSLSVSFSLSPSPVVPAKATHRRSFFLLLLLKSWKPCEVIWLSADGRAQGLCLRVCVCVGVFGLLGRGELMWGEGREHHLPNTRKGPAVVRVL